MITRSSGCLPQLDDEKIEMNNVRELANTNPVQLDSMTAQQSLDSSIGLCRMLALTEKSVKSNYLLGELAPLPNELFEPGLVR